MPGCVVCCVQGPLSGGKRQDLNRRDVLFSQEELRMRALREVQINPLRVARGTMSEAEALALLHELAREMAELVLR